MATDRWSRVNPRQMLSGLQLRAGRSPQTPASFSQEGSSCFHFKKHGSCKFGGDEGCRNGTHPAEFKIAGGLPAPFLRLLLFLLALSLVMMLWSVSAGCARSSFLRARMSGLLKRNSRLCLGIVKFAGRFVINSGKRKLLLSLLLSSFLSLLLMRAPSAVVPAAAADASGAGPEDEGGFSNDAWDEVFDSAMLRRISLHDCRFAFPHCE